MMTARNAGMRAIGVSWGFRPVEELLEAGAEVILGSPSELLEWVG
jgi:phosphoglycolate phosphatase